MRRELIPLLRSNGLEVLDPWHSLGLATPGATEPPERLNGDHAAAPSGAGEAVARVIAERNESLLDRCSGVFAVLDGPDVDSGVACEVGYASARGKPIVGWRGDQRRSGESVATLVNLQVEHCIRTSGGLVTRSLADGVTHLVRVLTHRSARKGQPLG